MKALWGVLLAVAVVACIPASAENPQVAYGVSIVGNDVNCGIPFGLRCTNLTGRPYILLGGYYSVGDGGGYFAMGPSGCTDNGGTILKDSAGNCFYRQDSRAAVPVQWFGAKCDAVVTVLDGSISKGSNTFTATNPVFQPGDVGKVFEFDNGSNTPFRTTVATYVSPTVVTLSTSAYHDFPTTGGVGAKAAKFSSALRNGLDSPGYGYEPADVLTVQGGTQTSPATADVVETGLVDFNQTSGGLGYRVNDLITFTATDSTDYRTVQAAVVRVTVVDQSTGAVTAYQWVDNGNYRPKGAASGNPAAFTIGSTSIFGTGFAIGLKPADASFGVARVSNPVQAGQYTVLPDIPSPTTNSVTSRGTGATIDLIFPAPTWTYGTDDTIALQGLETWLEADTNRGIYGAAEVPSGKRCLLQTLVVNRPVAWHSSGARQGQLLQIMGAQGSQVDTSSPFGFILVAAGLPQFDRYQNATAGQQEVGFDNISIAGGTNSTTVDVDANQGQAYTNDGLLFQNPLGKQNTFVAGVLRDLQVIDFPGNGLVANHFQGLFRAYNVYAGNITGNCVDIENTANPYRFYGLVASTCTGNGLNLVNTGQQEFHGASIFTTNIDVSITGSTKSDGEGYILFDGLQLGPSQSENMYLDQQNETVICAANCQIKDADAGAPGAIVIGPDASTIATELTPIVLQLNQGSFYQTDVAYDIYFATDRVQGQPCNCRVALGGGMFDANAQPGTTSPLAPGTPTTNDTALLTGQTSYAPPTFGNAATVGAPLSLGPAEFGIGLSKDTESQPKGAGVKLRVECGTAHPGTARIVALAGSSTIPTIVADNIGTCP